MIPFHAVIRSYLERLLLVSWPERGGVLKENGVDMQKKDWTGFQFAYEKLCDFKWVNWVVYWLHLTETNACFVFVDSIAWPDGKGRVHTAAYSDQESPFKRGGHHQIPEMKHQFTARCCLKIV